MSAAEGPLPAQERLVCLDVVRGLAVLGILVMNVVEFGLPLRAYTNPAYAGGSTGADGTTFLLQTALFDGKMRALFSMLFGAGLVLIDRRLSRSGRGEGAADLLLRRCLWLVPIGIVHRFALQWTGDILYTYGLLGAVALVFRHLPARPLIVLGLSFLAAAVPVAFWQHDQAAAVREQAASALRMEQANEAVPAELRQAQSRWQRRVDAIPPDPQAVADEVAAIRGGYTSVFAHRWDHHHSFQSGFVYYIFVWDVLGMMLLGMGLMQTGFFAGTCRRRVYVAMLGVGALSATGAFAWASAWAGVGFSTTALELRLVHDAVQPFERTATALAWASLAILLTQSRRAVLVTGALANVGRMAFSNYVLQTVCCTLFFFGYGLGYYGRLSRAETMWVVLAVTALQIGCSGLWLRWFRFGPLEWLWRSLTYGRRQPWRTPRA